MEETRMPDPQVGLQQCFLLNQRVKTEKGATLTMDTEDFFGMLSRILFIGFLGP